jgi:MFS family permease
VRVLAGAGGGTVLIALFAVHALRRRESALIDVRLLRERAFAAATGGLFLYSAAMFGLMILLPLYAQVARAQTALEAGWLLAPLGLGAMVTMSFAGRLTDRHGGRRLAIAGLLAVLCGTLALTTVGPDTGRPFLMGAVLVIGLGHGIMAPALMAAVYQGLPRASIPGATAGASVLVRIGSSVGTAVLAIVLQFSGAGLGPAPAEAFAHTFRWALFIAALALVPILAVPRRARDAVAV